MDNNAQIKATSREELSQFASDQRNHIRHVVEVCHDPEQ